MGKKPLTKKQLFIKEFPKDLNATQAAIRAGYSPKTAYSQGQRLLKDVEIQAQIQEAMEKRIERTEISADYVLKKLNAIAEMDILDIMDDSMALKPVREWPKIWRQYLNGFELAEIIAGAGDEKKIIGVLKKIKWPDKMKNLELLGRHFGMFTDKLIVEVDEGLSDMLKKARERSDEKKE